MSLALGLVGWPIQKSRSPLLHQAALRAHHLEGSYQLLPAQDEAAAWASFEAFARGRWHGLNVTLPYKHLAARFCMERGQLCGVARQLGVVNTLVHGQEGIEGHNTDVPGLIAAIQAVAPKQHFPKVALIGAGGAAYAAAYAALQLGAQELCVFNRTPATAETLIASLGVGRLAGSMAEACDGADLVLQASSFGMGAEGQAFEDAFDQAECALKSAPSHTLVVDLVYQPLVTPFVAAARNRGLKAEHGLGMLVHQAALAFSLWTQVPPPVHAMAQALQTVL